MEQNERVLDRVKELAPQIAERRREVEEERRIPADLLQRLKEAGCVRMFVPESHDGLHVSLRTGLQVLEALSRADGAVGWTMMLACESPLLFSLMSRETFDTIYSGGADVILAGGFSAQGQAHRQADGYEVTGKWAFATGCGHADWLFGNCVVMEDGKPRPGPAAGIPETRGMMFRAADVRVLDTWRVLGLRGTGSHDIAVESVKVPSAHSFDIFAGVPSIPSPHYVMPSLQCGLHMGAVAVGIAQGALDELITLMNQGTKRLYARSSTADSPVFQHRLGRADAALRAARSALHDEAESLWEAAQKDPPAVLGLMPRIMSSLAWIAETAAGVVDACYSTAGGNAARDSSPLQQRFRDIHTLAQHAGVADGWHLQSGLALLGRPVSFGF